MVIHTGHRATIPGLCESGHITCGSGHITCDSGHITCSSGHITCDPGRIIFNWRHYMRFGAYYM